MSKIKLKHSSGNSMSIAAPATNPASDLSLQLPNTVGTGKINHGNVLEQFFTPCDGSAITVPSGTYTVGNVTALQDLTTSYADVTGSSIAYTPPTGTTQVIYEYRTVSGGYAASTEWTIPHFRLYLDSDEVVYQRTTITARDYMDDQVQFKYTFNIGGSANTNTGRVASWSGAKTIKIQAREYGSSNQARLHCLFHWDGGTGSTFHQPSIGITAIGTPT
jgi:hypothetical protein